MPAIADWATDVGKRYSFRIVQRGPPEGGIIPRRAMRQAIAAGAQGAVVRGGPFFSAVQRRVIIDSAAELRLPVIYERRDDAAQGGLMSYSADHLELYRATAGYVARILAGENAGELPVQQPSKFELVINLKTAKALGIDVPPSLLARADEVIE